MKNRRSEYRIYWSVTELGRGLYIYLLPLCVLKCIYAYMSVTHYPLVEIVTVQLECFVYTLFLHRKNEIRYGRQLS